MSDFNKPEPALTWEYIEYLEALNERLTQQVVGITDRVQESVRGIQADAWDQGFGAGYQERGGGAYSVNPYRTEVP